jgi:P pilus assembly chaperone PapD
MNRINKLVLILGFVMAQLIGVSQSASVSPSRLYYNVAPGSYKSQKLRVTNNGTKAQTFTVNFANFNSPGNKGKSVLDTSRNSEHGMADWLTASPSFFEVAPGETKDVEILLQLPNTPDANTVRWAVASVKLARENKGQGEKGENITGMSIIPTFSFVIHLFQTPPNVNFKEVVVEKFYRDSLNSNDSITILKMEARNTGDAIANCAPYLDMVNLKTGEKSTVKGKGFTMLPGGVREVAIQLPSDLPKGEYNILGIVDYDSETDVAAMELNIKLE